MASRLKSPALEHRQRIPARYAVNGNDLSPALEWPAPPAGTRSYRLIVDGPAAPSGTFRQWGLHNIMNIREAAQKPKIVEAEPVGTSAR